MEDDSNEDVQLLLAVLNSNSKDTKDTGHSK